MMSSRKAPPFLPPLRFEESRCGAALFCSTSESTEALKSESRSCWGSESKAARRRSASRASRCWRRRSRRLSGSSGVAVSWRAMASRAESEAGFRVSRNGAAPAAGEAGKPKTSCAKSRTTAAETRYFTRNFSKFSKNYVPLPTSRQNTSEGCPSLCREAFSGRDKDR